MTDHPRPKPSRNRSRRQRKKMHLAEFQDLGFEINFELDPSASAEQTEQTWDDLLAELLKADRYLFGGSNNTHKFSFWIERRARQGRTDENDRTQVEAWLQARPEVVSLTIGPLRDGWYDPEPEPAAA